VEDHSELLGDVVEEAVPIILFSGFAFGPALLNISTSYNEWVLGQAQKTICNIRQMLKDIAADPEDANYRPVVTPTFSSLDPAYSEAGRSVLEPLTEVEGYGRAMLTSYERYLGALAAGDTTYVSIQAAAI